jgi:CO/xanthine dehydrogenase Mo-binding subunit
MLDCDPLEFSLQGERIVARSDASRSVSLVEVAAEFEALGKSRRVVGMLDLTAQFPDGIRPDYIPIFVTGAQVAQVLVDMQSGLVTVQRIIAAHDVGRAINPSDAAGQVQGAVLMGVGTALSEEYIPGISSGFTNYVLPMIDAMPQTEVILVETPSRYGPYGAKGLGEAALLPTAPAIVNGLSRAIGVRIRRLPATPPRLLQALGHTNTSE